MILAYVLVTSDRRILLHAGDPAIPTTRYLTVETRACASLGEAQWDPCDDSRDVQIDTTDVLALVRWAHPDLDTLLSTRDHGVLIAESTDPRRRHTVTRYGQGGYRLMTETIATDAADGPRWIRQRSDSLAYSDGSPCAGQYDVAALLATLAIPGVST